MKRTNKAIINLRKRERAHKLRVPSNPPDFTAVPWYHLILRIQNPAANLTTGVIISNFITQTGLNTTTEGIDIRLNSIRVWGALKSLASDKLQPLRLAVYDPVGSSSSIPGGTGGTGRRVLDVITDFPDAVNRAALGYTFSSTQRQVAIACPTGGTTPLFNLNGVGPDSVCYIDLLWRSPNINILV